MATRSIRVNSIQKHSEEGGGGEGCEEHQPLSGDGSREKEKKRREEWSGEHTPMGGVGRGGVFKRTWDVVPLHPTLCMVGTNGVSVVREKSSSHRVVYAVDAYVLCIHFYTL